MPDQNPYADFGGSVAQLAPPAAPQAAPPTPSQPVDPYAQFGGQTAQTQSQPTAKTVGDLTGDPTHILQDGKIIPIVKQSLTSPNTVGGIIDSQDAGAAKGTQYEGLAKLGQAALNGITDHIMAGSPIEKLIQKMNPDFRGTGAAYNARNVLTNGTPLAGKPTSTSDAPTVFTAPIVDAGQFIDKKKHPVAKAVAEAAQSLTSPESVAILASTGGLGMVENPAALGTANRLLSAGFSAQSIGEAYKNSKAFKAAYDKGDREEAEYALTHLVLNGAIAAMAGQYAAGVEAAPATSVGQKAGDVVAKTSSAVSDAAGSAVDAVTAAPGKAAGAITKTIEAIKPEWLTKKVEGDIPQHGTPVPTPQPLDSATVSKQLGGRNLSQDALDTLQGHVGDNIEVGSTAKNTLMKAVQPVAETIDATSKQMNDVVQKAPKFTTSAAQDSGIGDGTFFDDIDNMKRDLSASNQTFGKDIDGVVKDADTALNSHDPAAVLEYRRQLGQKIDWGNIVKSPDTAGEAQNLARVRVYRELSSKIHADVPDTIPLDKVLEPNLELRSHMKQKGVIGERAFEDPMAATAEHQSELRKGRDKVAVDEHNSAVDRNWNVLKALGLLGAASGVGDAVRHLVP